jgi:hypothetical protein
LWLCGGVAYICASNVTIYSDIASAILGVLPDFTIGGSGWTVTRTTGDGVTSAVTTATHSITAYVIRDKVDKFAQALAGTPTPDAPFVIFAQLSTNVQVNDLLTNTTDSTVKFRVRGPLSTDLGMMIGEVELQR